MRKVSGTIGILESVVSQGERGRLDKKGYER